MAFTGLLTKLGSNECNEFFSDIKSRNKFETEDNTVLTVLRAVMNEERLATFTADFEARLPEYLRKALHPEAVAT